MSLFELLIFCSLHTSNLPGINQTDIPQTTQAEPSKNFIEPVWTKETNAPILSSIKLADVNSDSTDEILVTTYDTPPASYNGGWVYILDKHGDNLPGWPKRTSAPFPADPVIGDIDNDGDMEIVVGDWSRVHAWHHDGNYVSGFPISRATNTTAALADLDRDEDLEIIYACNDKKIYIWHHNATNYTNWPQTLPELAMSPTVADIDNDDTLEIIAGTYQGPVGPNPFEVYVFELNGTIRHGFPFSTSGVVKSTPAIGDIDNDGKMEIAVCSYAESGGDYIYALDDTAGLEPGFPIRASSTRLSSIALADLDNDGDLEILIGGAASPLMERLYAFHHDGTAFQNFPVILNHSGSASNVNSSPIVADIDGDSSKLEIFVKATDNIFCVHSNGTIMTGFPYYLPDQGHTGTYSPSPAVGDIDDDGLAEYVFASCFSTVAFFDDTLPFSQSKAFWPMYKHDRYGTGTLPGPRIGIKEYSSPKLPQFNFEIIPNPARSVLHVRCPLTANNIKIFDVSGKVVKVAGSQGGKQEMRIALNGMNPGVYFLKLGTDRKKFLIAR